MRTAALSVGATGLLYVSDPGLFHCGVRLTRCGVTACVGVLDYKYSRYGLEGQKLHESLAESHTRNAQRLKYLAFANKGLYIKVGQYLAMMDYLVPHEYVKAMQDTFDNAPVTPFENVRLLVKEELGRDPSDLFHSFDPVPIASASLAQVHIATTKEGQKLAIKVQHEEVQRMATTEASALEFILQAIRKAAPEVGLQWLVEEIRYNLPRELDFRIELDNSNTCREICKRFGNRVVVPRCLPELSSKRILTMEFEGGVQLTDLEGLKQQRIDSRGVIRLLSEVFCEMVFVKGVVHCDPHPGNVLVRPMPGPSSKDGATGNAQLIILDHGLYRRISDELRLDYCELWKSIILADVNGIKSASERMGIHSPWMTERYPGLELSHTLIAAMLTAQEWDKIAQSGDSLDRLERRATTDEHKQQEHQQLTNNVQEYFRGIVDILESAPRDLLLLLKTNDALRSAATQLSARSEDSFVVTAKTCVRALWNAGPGNRGTYKGFFGSIHYYINLALCYWKCQLYLLTSRR